MLEVNWNQTPPVWTSDVLKLWREIQITPVVFQSEAIHNYLQHLRTTHGGVVFAGFHLGQNLTLDWYASRNRLEEMEFFSSLLTHPVVKDHVPELRIGNPLRNEPQIHQISSLTLDGELAQTLVSGGAYEKFMGSARLAKEIAGDFCESLFEGRYEEVLVYESPTPWSDWFRDIAWDVTWFILDRRRRYLWLLCATDED